MISLIVFSKDRPMQLQATLDSFEHHARGQVNRTTVIYKSSPEYQAGYDLLIGRRPNVIFIRQGDFKTCLFESFVGDWTLFAADDDICYRDWNRALLSTIDEKTACFSLRLGLNVTYCYSNDKPNTLADWREEGDFIRWKWRKELLDFGYPLSVVSHIFRTSEIRQFTEQADFNDPNQYEGQLQRYLAYVRPEMVSYKESRVFGVPANRVNESCQNRNGLTHSYTTKELNDRYLAGEIIDLASMKFDINAAQQEIEYAFKKA